MIGTLTTPINASTAPALSARRGSSIAACNEMNPRYRKRRINSEVSRASHTHHVPHVGLPQNDPVQRAIKVISAPVGAMAEAIIEDSLVLKARPNPAQNAMTT